MIEEKTDITKFPCGAVMWRQGKRLHVQACCPTCLVLKILRQEAAREGVPVIEPSSMN